MQIHLNAYQISFYLNANESQTHSDKEVMSFLVNEFYRSVNNLKVQFCWTCTLSLILYIPYIHSPSSSPLFLSTLSTLFLSTLSLIILNIILFAVIWFVCTYRRMEIAKYWLIRILPSFFIDAFAQIRADKACRARPCISSTHLTSCANMTLACIFYISVCPDPWENSFRICSVSSQPI